MDKMLNKDALHKGVDAVADKAGASDAIKDGAHKAVDAIDVNKAKELMAKAQESGVVDKVKDALGGVAK